jgi:diguanylate cyclase (GGDEF)-like protein
VDPTLAAYSSALVLSCLLSIGLAVVGYFRREVPGAVAFLFCNLACFFYAFGSLLEIRATGIDAVMTALTTEYLGITTLGPFLLLASLSATKGLAFPRRSVLLFILPAVILTLVATNSLHHLYYSSVELTRRGPFTVPVLGKGPFYMIQFAFLNLCIGWAVLTSFRATRQASGDRRQALLLFLAATLVPWAGMVWYQSGGSPWGLDTAPFGLSIAGGTMAVALFRYRLFDVTPMVTDQVFANMKEGVMVVDARRRLVGINPAMTEILPALEPSLVGRDGEELTAKIPALEALFHESEAGTDLEIASENGRRIFQIDRSPLRDRRGRPSGTIYLLSDITQREELSAKLSRLARTDELTGLPNRRSFLERLEDSLDRHRRYGAGFSLAIADLDHFKAVNDTWGHEAGDAALLHLATLWSSCLRASDLLARYGGEEFTVLMPRSSVDEARILIERARSRLEASPLVWKGDGIRLTASFGLTSVTGQDDTVKQLIRRADLALYWVKEHGRNQIKIAEAGVR